MGVAQEDLPNRVRALRERGYTPREIARSLGISSAEASRLVRAEAIRRQGSDHAPREDEIRCFVNPGWHEGLVVRDHAEWLAADGNVIAPRDAGGVAIVLVATPRGYRRLEVCSFLVDTWCLGVKNAVAPKRMSTREFEELRRAYFAPWGGAGIAVSLEFARHLVLGAVEYARGLGFEPHRDFSRARAALGTWDGASAIGFGRDGMPCYRSGPYDDPDATIATLERTVGRGGFHFSIDVGSFDEHGDGYRYTVTISDDEGPAAGLAA